LLEDGTIMRIPSLTEHPASVGESYLQHLHHASGFALSMIGGGLACLVHAVLPFLFAKTGSGVVADLSTRMIAGRRRQSAPRQSTQRPLAPPRSGRITAA
jgi:hypothetical protein